MEDSENGGRLGLWKICEKNELGDSCNGKLEEIMEISSLPFQVCTQFHFLLLEVSYSVNFFGFWFSFVTYSWSIRG